MKATVIAVILMLCLATASFASGEDQDGEFYPDRWGPVSEEMPETQIYNGTFKMEENEYPAILTDGGKLYYLMFPAMPLSSDVLPAEGTELRIEAFKAPFSPIHLMIISAEVDGEVVDFMDPMELYDERYYDQPYRWMGRMGYYGPHGRHGWGYYGHHGYGPRGYYEHHGHGPWGDYDWDNHEH